MHNELTQLVDDMMMMTYQTLKQNLLLPGVGRFTVYGDKTVTAEDLGSKFFVCPDRVGSARAVAVTDLLCELNLAVKVPPPCYMPMCALYAYYVPIICLL